MRSTELHVVVSENKKEEWAFRTTSAKPKREWKRWRSLVFVFVPKIYSPFISFLFWMCERVWRPIVSKSKKKKKQVEERGSDEDNRTNGQMNETNDDDKEKKYAFVHKLYETWCKDHVLWHPKIVCERNKCWGTSQV